MKDVKWIKIVADIFDDDKMVAIETLPDGLAIEVVWFKILCLAGSCNNSGFLTITKDVPYTNEALAKRFRMDNAIIVRALEVFQAMNMIEVVDDIYMVSNWMMYQNEKGLEDIRRKNAEKQKAYRERQKAKKQALLEDKESEEEKSVTSQRYVTDEVTSYVTPSISISNNNIYKFNNILTNNYIYADYILENESLKAAMEDWCNYKDEKKPKKDNQYTERGLKTWLKQMCEASKKYGVSEVVECINYAISHEWKGVYLDRLQKKQPSRIEGIEDW